MSTSSSSNGARNPERLLVCDFDGTEFDTFESPPNGVGVDEAYRMSIEEVFDFDTRAVERYEEQGGHQNRTPAEIVTSLAPSATPQGVLRLTRKLVAVKLSILNDQIGMPLDDGNTWPRPMPGFIECWEEITAARWAGLNITTANISAGHDRFIRRCFENVGLEIPDILVTHETIEGLSSSEPLSRLTKPSSFPYWLVKLQWAHRLSEQEDEIARIIDSKGVGRILYVGDDPKKDGGLATNAGIEFMLINRGNSPESWKQVGQFLGLGSAALQGVLEVEQTT